MATTSATTTPVPATTGATGLTPAEQLKQLVDKPIKVAKFRGIRGDPSVDAWITQQLYRLHNANIDEDQIIAGYLVTNGLADTALEWVTPYLLQPRHQWDHAIHPCVSTDNLRTMLKQCTGQDTSRETRAIKRMQVKNDKVSKETRERMKL